MEWRNSMNFVRKHWAREKGKYSSDDYSSSSLHRIHLLASLYRRSRCSVNTAQEDPQSFGSRDARTHVCLAAAAPHRKLPHAAAARAGSCCCCGACVAARRKSNNNLGQYKFVRRDESGRQFVTGIRTERTSCRDIALFALSAISLPRVRAPRITSELLSTADLNVGKTRRTEFEMKIHNTLEKVI